MTRLRASLVLVAALFLAAPAVLAQPTATATELFLPIASRTPGVTETEWRTRLWIIAGEEPAEVTIELYPTSLGGLPGPTDVVTRSVAAGSQLYIEDLVGDLYGFNGNGAIRLVATAPIAAFARVVNIKMPAALEGGTFGQAMPAMALGDEVTSGALPGLFNERISDQSGFRTNLGWFNPGSSPVTLTARVVTAAGVVLGERTFDVAARSQWLGSVFDVVWTVPQNQRELENFFVTYELSGGSLFLYASVVDNVTGDAVTILPTNAP